MVTRSEIKRRVGDSVVKGIRERNPSVTDRANVGSKLEDVLPMSPGNIIRNVVDGSHTAQTMFLIGGLKDKAKTDVIPVAVATVGKGLTRVAVAYVVHQ